MDAGKWYLGLDGGGTKTHCVLYDAATGALYSTRAGPTNHETLPGGCPACPGPWTASSARCSDARG